MNVNTHKHSKMSDFVICLLYFGSYLRDKHQCIINNDHDKINTRDIDYISKLRSKAVHAQYAFTYILCLCSFVHLLTRNGQKNNINM